MQIPASVVTKLRSEPDGGLLEFVAPGLAHALGNHLFAIQGCVQVLKDGPAGHRQRATILEATAHAGEVLEALRLLSDDFGADQVAEQAGVLLARIAPLCRVPLRERGLRLAVEHTSARRPRLVDARAFTRCTIDLLRRVATTLPAFVEGEVHVDLADQTPQGVELRVRMVVDPTCLPFPVDLDPVVRGLTEVHGARGVEASRVDASELRVLVPAASRP